MDKELEKLEKKCNGLRILAIVIAVLQLALVITVCLTCKSQIAIVINVICLLITAFELGGMRSDTRYHKRIKAMIDDHILSETIRIMAYENALSKEPTIARERADIIEVVAVSECSSENPGKPTIGLYYNLGREAMKYARIQIEDKIGGPLDHHFKDMRATLRVVPFKDGGTGCGD